MVTRAIGYRRNDRSLLKESDRNDPNIQAMKRRKKASNSMETNTKTTNEVKQPSIDNFFGKRKDENKSKSKINKDKDDSYYNSDSDVITIPQTSKKNKKTNKNNRSQKDANDKPSKRRSTKTSSDVDDDEEEEEEEDDNDDSVVELKPLQSFVSVKSVQRKPNTAKILLESAETESTYDLSLKSGKFPKLFQPIMTSKDIQDLKVKLEREYNIPSPMYSTELLEKCKPLLDIVKYVLKGVIPSSYYDNAKTLSKESYKPFFSLHDVPMVTLNKFIAGFYGWKRQTLVGELIFTEYQSELSRSKSTVVKWWGPKDFATFVLAPEVLILLTIFQMNIGPAQFRSHLKYHLNDLSPDDIENLLDYNSDVMDIFEATVEYGSSVMDSEPLEPWEGKLLNKILSSPSSSSNSSSASSDSLS